MISASAGIAAQLGYAADPGIEMLLPKDKLAQIKLRKIDIAIQELKSAVEALSMQRDMLCEEYKIR